MSAFVEKIDFTVNAPLEVAYAVLVDVEALPDWSATHSSVRVLSRDENGFPCLVEARLGMIGISDDLTFQYTFSENRCEWLTASEGSALRSQGGFYQLVPASSGTRVRAELHIEPKIKLPGFLIKRAISAVADIASTGFTKEVHNRINRA